MHGDRVRRRWASLWLKQGGVARAEAIARVQRARDAERSAAASAAGAVGSEDGVEDEEASDRARARQRRWLELHKGPRANQERWRWRELRRRIQKEKTRASG